MQLFLKSALSISLIGLLWGISTTTQNSRKKIIFFGDSLTAGYGITMEEAFPNLIQQRIDSLGLPYEVVNAGLSGETTAGGANRIDWILRSEPAVFILELGGNDGLRGLSLDQTRANLVSMIEKVRGKYPNAVILLAGMQMFPNMGPEYIEQFKETFPEVAKAKEVNLIPFLLEGVGGEEDLNLPDGIHPNPEGHRLVAENVWAVLKTVLEN